jgi:hypothetical protein
MAYRFDRFRREHLRGALALPPGPGAGRPLPPFDLPSVDGDRLRSAELAGGRAMLVAFASLTDPIAASAAPVLRQLHAAHGTTVAFLTVYVREAHPGDRIPQPRTAEWKARHAKLLRDRDAIPWPVLVDDLDGGFHRAVGGTGASAHLVDGGGAIAFETPLSNDRRALAAALRGLGSGGAFRAAPPPPGSRLVPALCGLARADEVIRAAGPRAIDDLRREAPLLYGAAELAWLWRTLTPAGRLALAAAGALAIAGALAGPDLLRRSRRRT